MDFSQLAQVRRSVRSFANEPISDEDVRAILRAALWAPAGRDCRAGRFVVVSDRKAMKALSDCRADGSQFLAKAQLAIVVLGDKSKSDTWVEDATIAAVSMQYQAVDLGLGCCWCQVRGRNNANLEPSDAVVHRVLNLPQWLQVECIVGIGHPATSVKRHRDAELKWDRVMWY